MLLSACSSNQTCEECEIQVQHSCLLVIIFLLFGQITVKLADQCFGLIHKPALSRV